MSQPPFEAPQPPQDPQAPPAPPARPWKPAPWSYTLRPTSSSWPSAEPPAQPAADPPGAAAPTPSYGPPPAPPAWRRPPSPPPPPPPRWEAPATVATAEPEDGVPVPASGDGGSLELRGAASRDGPAQPAGGQAAVDTTGRQNQPGTNQSAASWNLEPHVEFYDVYKAFGSFRVLDGVTFRIPRGGVTVLMGPSGTGKSVALRHLVGLLMPDKGDIVVDGMHVPSLNDRDLLALRRSVGMLFQDGALFSSMNLYDNVAFPLRQHTRRSEGEIREIVIQRLSEVGLAGAEKRMPNELSGGMRKRAGFARGLVMEPRLFLVDEPDSGLDPVRTTLLCDLIKEIAAKHHATVIVVSHNVEAVRRIADYVGILYKGKMRHFGTLDEIQRSQDEFVRQFFNADAEGPLGMD